MVNPGYFETLGIPRIAGNDFGSESATGPKTAIVNEEFVKDILGAKIKSARRSTAAGPHTRSLVSSEM